MLNYTGFGITNRKEGVSQRGRLSRSWLNGRVLNKNLFFRQMNGGLTLVVVRHRVCVLIGIRTHKRLPSVCGFLVVVLILLRLREKELAPAI